MNFEFFIAKRIIDSKAYKSSVSAPIIKIGIAAIAIGIIVMMITIATGIGLQQKIRDKVSAFNGHIIISNFESNNSQESGKPISTQQDFYPNFKSVDGIKNVQAVASKFGIIRTETDFEAIIVKGVGGDYDWNYFKEFLVEGRLPDFSKDRNQDVLISQELANKMQFKLGDKFTTFFRKDDPNKPPTPRRFTIVGIYNSGLKEFDETYVIGDIKHIQHLNKWDANQVGHFEVLLDDYNQLDAKFKAVFQNTPSLLQTVTVEQKHSSIFEWISIFDKNIYGLISIMILVAGINMITALLVLILERTKMIGIFKALGSNNWSIRKVFLYNASYIILIGLFWGNLIGFLLLLTQKYFKLFPLDPSVYHVSEVPIDINLGYILALNIGTFILCLLMLLIPSYIITKISPVKAIRFE
ncbi:ABC transporter permease [Lacinutrix iliipiscaria]|uniref:ABC transporter permease n=1 Tax=Lacinutrix iliipiscaria TaxID=1230532 RepID=A0ABW5WQE3_9FLAO